MAGWVAQHFRTSHRDRSWLVLFTQDEINIEAPALIPSNPGACDPVSDFDALPANVILEVFAVHVRCAPSANAGARRIALELQDPADADRPNSAASTPMTFDQGENPHLLFGPKIGALPSPSPADDPRVPVATPELWLPSTHRLIVYDLNTTNTFDDFLPAVWAFVH